MKRRAGILIIFVGTAFLFLTAFSKHYTELTRFTVWNRTGETVYLRLTGGPTYYSLTAFPGVNEYTIDRGKYRMSYWACDRRTNRSIKIYNQTKVTFLPCNRRIRYYLRNRENLPWLPYFRDTKDPQ